MNEHEFVNRKGVHPINVQLVCNADMHIMNSEVKRPGFFGYMANQNSFKELADKFNVGQSTAHDVVIRASAATFVEYTR